MLQATSAGSRAESAANSAAVLLASANAAHPNGLANGSDQVGRNYMFHTLTAMVSLTAAHVDVTFAGETTAPASSTS